MRPIAQPRIPRSIQPRPGDYAFDLKTALSSVVGLHAIIADDAFTADTLGVERTGSGVVIGSHLVLTIGYLITEAETVWLHCNGNRTVPGYVLAMDQDTSFGLVRTLERLDLPALPLGSSASLRVGEDLVLASAGGQSRSMCVRIAAKQEFAGYWEYVLDEAIFTSPSHPNWGGAALISSRGELVGISSLKLEHERREKIEHLNMVVPIDLFTPIQRDLEAIGKASGPVRPWLGVFCTHIEDKIVIVGIATNGPAADAGMKVGDIISAVNGEQVATLVQFYRKIWTLGYAGVDVPLTLYRNGVTFDVSVRSSDRAKFLKSPTMH